LRFWQIFVAWQQKRKKEKASLIDTKAFFFFFFWGREIINGPKSPHYEEKNNLNLTEKNKIDLKIFLV